MYRLLRSILFRLDAEDTHRITLRLLAAASHIPALTKLRKLTAPDDPLLTQTLWGRKFLSPIGLAAGLDKDAKAVYAFCAMGFGFVEVGTVTPVKQPGNPRPRLFRLPADKALINRMGFNNAGSQALQARLSALRNLAVPIWVNIGKNKTTPNHEATGDYLKCVNLLQNVADAFVLNVSSPNTPGLRDLQHAKDLAALVRAVLSTVEAGPPIPVLVKLAPDLSPLDFEASLEALLEVGVNGLIISNTTLHRGGLQHANKAQSGGLSGQPLQCRSNTLIRKAYRLTRGHIPIIGVGGIFTAEDAYTKIRAGATLTELYTALVYEGPGLPAQLNRGLSSLLKRDGFSSVTQAVGIDA